MAATFLHKPTGLVFENRKQAKQYFGLSRYNQELKESNFVFQNPSDNETQGQ